MALLSVVVACAAVNTSAQSVFTIGNSLTWDALPAALDGDVSWHVDCNKNLPFIFSGTEGFCLANSTPWPNAFKSTSFDVVTVQPFTGSSLEEDVKIISTWMQEQPEAAFVIHSGWASIPSLVTTYEMPNVDNRMLHSRAYFRDLLEAVASNHPEREIGYTHALDLIYSVAKDIEVGIAPLDSPEQLFRDATHLEQNSGRYLVHNAMRYALGQPFSDEGFNIDPHLAQYFQDKIVRIADELPQVDAMLTDPGMLHPGSGASDAGMELKSLVPPTVTNTPEPSSLALLLLFFAGILMHRHRWRATIAG
jgi:hypothetical protein